MAPTVRFNATEIRATPDFLFANDFSSRTSDAVQARLTVFFFAFFVDFFFLAISALLSGSRLVSRRQDLATRRGVRNLGKAFVRHARQDWPFDIFFAADIASPVICLICSPAFVNWLLRNAD